MQQVGPALVAAAQGDVARAFDVFLRSVGGDGYREVLRARLADDDLVVRPNHTSRNHD